MIDDGSPSTTSSGDDFTIGDVLAENHLLREERAELIAQLKLATLREQASLQRLRTDESKRTELESQLKDLQERLCEQSNEILSILPLRLKLNEVRQRADTLKVDLQCAEGSISDLTRKLQRKETAWEKLQVELLEARCEIDTLALKVRELSAEKKALQAAGLKKGTIIASLSADVESLRAEIEKSEEQKFELLADRSHWEKKALTLSKELARIAGGATGEIQLKRDVEDLRQDNLALRSQLHVLQRQNDSQPNAARSRANNHDHDHDHDEEGEWEEQGVQAEESCLCNGLFFFAGDRRRKTGGSAYTGID